MGCNPEPAAWVYLEQPDPRRSLFKSRLRFPCQETAFGWWLEKDEKRWIHIHVIESSCVTRVRRCSFPVGVETSLGSHFGCTLAHGWRRLGEGRGKPIWMVQFCSLGEGAPGVEIDHHSGVPSGSERFHAYCISKDYFQKSLHKSAQETRINPQVYCRSRFGLPPASWVVSWFLLMIPGWEWTDTRTTLGGDLKVRSILSFKTDWFSTPTFLEEMEYYMHRHPAGP